MTVGVDEQRESSLRCSKSHRKYGNKKDELIPILTLSTARSDICQIGH